MKTFKKALSIVLGLAMMLSCVAGMQISASAEGTSSFTVTVGDGSAKAGQIVEVPVTLSNVVGGYTALGFAIDYDPAVLTLAEKVAVTGNYDGTGDSTTSTFVFEQSENLTDRPYNLIWAYVDDEPNTADGIVATLKFTVNANATAGATTTVAIAANAKSGSMNGNEDVDVTYVAGTVTVASEEPECEHHWTIVTQPTKTETGLKVRTCTLCDEVEEVVIDIPVLDTTMVFRTPNVTIGETLGLRLRARTSVLNDATATYKFVVTPQKYNTTTQMEETGETVEYDVVKSGTNYQVDLSGISITELGLDVNAYIVRYNAEGIFEAYSEIEAANPATVLKGMVNASAVEGTTAYKLNTMIGDLLALGAEAQEYFPKSINSTTCDLYTAERVNVGVEKWASAELGELNVVDTTTNTVWNPDSAITATTNRLSMEVSLNPAPAPTFVVRNASPSGTNPLDFSKLSMTISYTSEYDGKTRTETYEGDEWNDLISRNHLKAKFPKVAMYDSDQVITAVLTFDGVNVFTSTYTIETYISSQLSSAANGTIVRCIGMFGASARNYFLSLN